MSEQLVLLWRRDASAGAIRIQGGYHGCRMCALQLGLSGTVHG
jgi:hypothetical protein